MMGINKLKFLLLIFICVLSQVLFCFYTAAYLNRSIYKKVTKLNGAHLLKSPGKPVKVNPDLYKINQKNKPVKIQLKKHLKPQALKQHSTTTDANCYNINWATWTNFSGISATGTIVDENGDAVNITMNSNFTFGATPQIYNYSNFSGYPSQIPNAQVPETTWSYGPGGVTTMCFSKTVSNPVLLLSSLGSTDPLIPAELNFSLPYVVLFDGGGMQYNSSTSITGTEGYAIIMFPGDFTCVTINSTTYEYYTNITWGLRPPPFPIAITENSNTCAGDILTASGGVSCLWNDGDTPNNPTNTFHKSGTYIVTVTNADGCITSASKTIVVGTPPLAVISGDTTGCDNVTLTASGGASYLWSGGNSPNSASNTFNTSGLYTVDVTNAAGCKTTRSVTVIVSPVILPPVNIAVSPSDITCSGVPVTFTATVLNGGYSSSLQWLKNNVAVAAGTTYTTADLVNNDVIQCRLNGNATCSTPPTVLSNVITMTINPAPVITIDQNVVSANSSPVQLNPAIDGDVTSYSWSPATGLSDATIKSPLANPKVTTNYQLTVTSPNGCEATAGVTVIVETKFIVPNTFTPNGDGVNDVWAIASLSNYPDATVDIYNRWGQHLFHSVGYGKPWDGTYNGKPLPAGAYYYVIDLKDKASGPQGGWVAILR